MACGCGILFSVGAPITCAFMMVSVAQLVERPVVVREGAGSRPVSHPVVSHSVDGRVRKTPNLDRLVEFGVFRCYRAEKSLSTRGCGYRLAPGLDDTAHRAFNRVVGAFCVHRARATDALSRHPTRQHFPSAARPHAAWAAARTRGERESPAPTRG